MKINKKYKKKMVVALILLVLGLSWYAHNTLASPSWPLDKPSTCSLFNKSGEDCDKYWCENFLEGNWTTDQLCLKNQTEYINITINNTIYVNVTLNDSNLINSTNSTNLTTYNSTDLNISLDYLKNYTNNQTLILRDSIVDRIDNLTRIVYSQSGYGYRSDEPAEPWPWYSYAFILGILFFGLGYLTYVTMREKRLEKDEPEESIKKPYKPGDYDKILDEIEKKGE